MAKAKVNLRIREVKATIKNANDEVLKQFAYRITERTQMNIRENDQIDTGFMVNAIYPIWEDGSEYAQAKLQASGHRTSSKTGRTVDRDRMAPEARLKSGASAAVVVGANYAIYQEQRMPFLWPAAEESAREFGGTAQRIYEEKVHD